MDDLNVRIAGGRGKVSILTAIRFPPSVPTEFSRPTGGVSMSIDEPHEEVTQAT
jgi:hypothetical protein